MIACVHVTALSISESSVLDGSLAIKVSDEWSGWITASIPLSGSASGVNAAIKQAAADAVLKQHGVTLDPATEILLIGGAA